MTATKARENQASSTMGSSEKRNDGTNARWASESADAVARSRLPTYLLSTRPSHNSGRMTRKMAPAIEAGRSRRKNPATRPATVTSRVTCTSKSAEDAKTSSIAVLESCTSAGKR
jgi:hypothetical protein